MVVSPDPDTDPRLSHGVMRTWSGTVPSSWGVCALPPLQWKNGSSSEALGGRQSPGFYLAVGPAGLAPPVKVLITRYGVWRYRYCPRGSDNLVEASTTDQLSLMFGCAWAPRAAGRFVCRVDVGCSPPPLPSPLRTGWQGGWASIGRV